MNSRSRRGFLKTSGLGVVALSALDISREAGRAEDEAGQPPPIPPHRALAVPGVHAYPREHSVAAGGTLELCIGASVPYRLSICRLGTTVDDSSGDHVLASFPEEPARPHPIHPGSYVHVAPNLAGPPGALTLECWVRPWSITSDAGLITQYDYREACGFGLFLAPSGVLNFYLGDGGAYRPEWSLSSPPDLLQKGRWQHVAGTWDGREASTWVDGVRVARKGFEGPRSAGPAPLRLAAHGEGGVAAGFLDGDLALPAIRRRALGEDEVIGRFKDRGRTPPGGTDLLGCWTFDEEQGDRVADVSGNGRHGRVINQATWMVGGPSFNPDVPRFGPYDPKADPLRGHGLRFASDDLYDCRWPVARRWTVPPDAKPGLHVARFAFTYEGTGRVADVMFVVRRGQAARRPKAPILVLASTNTWRAYSGTPFAVAPADPRAVFGTGGLGKGEPGLPAFDLYRAHAAGQGTYQVGLRMPWPAAAPYVLYGGPTGYSHLARADRFAQVWLERNGYEYDPISDLDLHRDPAILKGYPVVVINGHNEYWSLPMYRGLEDYLRDDGRLIVLSGNTMFWRVSFNPDGSVMECRKVDAPGLQVPTGRRGEAWHSHDGARGGLLRECGHPGWRLIGLETLGWNNQGKPENFGPFVAEATDHPFFRNPEETGLKPGDKFAWAGEGRLPMANGHEFDVRPSTLAALQEQPSPEGAAVPADPDGIVRLANGIIPWSKGGSAFDYHFRPIKPKTDQGGEMIDWTRPEGGRVFNAGSIGSGWALDADPRWSTLLRNVLHHFGVARPGAGSGRSRGT